MKKYATNASTATFYLIIAAKDTKLVTESLVMSSKIKKKKKNILRMTTKWEGAIHVLMQKK